VGGAVIAREAEVHQTQTWWANCLGITGAPFDSFLTLRGLRTLDARLRVHQENTLALVELLDAHPAVRVVHYPGLPRHPGHAVAARQQSGFGAMLSVELEHGELEHGELDGEAAARAFLDGLAYFTLAESLGGVESLVAHPATMTHAAMSVEARAEAGIGDGLLRLSVGIEHVDDLVADISAALDRVCAVTSGIARVAT
jgi:cystathionine gamma-synthase